MHTAKEAGSSRSCIARDGSTRWINPRVAVLTGVETPTAPPPARGWNEEDILLLCAYTGRWRSDLVLVLINLVHRQSILDLSECVLRSITDLEIARHALDLSCAVWLFWPHGARGLRQRGFCYFYMSSSTYVVTMSFARPVYVPVSERGWIRACA